MIQENHLCKVMVTTLQSLAPALTARSNPVDRPHLNNPSYTHLMFLKSSLVECVV